ncbi:MAG: hypothetical protein IT529_17505 [Burkholderiales bacterium]|nr:hypothetical protein [Burkholderiales bacterium]
MTGPALRLRSTAAHSHAEAIRRHVLIGLAGSRTLGFHFPGYFLGIEWPRIDDDCVEGVLATGPHCINADGGLNLAAFGVLLDTSVAIMARMKIPHGQHQATVHLHAQFTGRPLSATLRSVARHAGDTSGAAVRQAIVDAVVTSGGEAVCRATSAFVRLPPLQGAGHGPLPRSRARITELTPLAASELDAGERRVYQAGERALKRADAHRSFIEHFWSVRPRPVSGGARCAIPLGPHYGNRTGDVQGGLLFGIAAATAHAAVPGHRHLSNVSAWYVGPGRGHRLTARSRVVHAGRSFATVRTELTRPGGARVLEVVSHHAA